MNNKFLSKYPKLYPIYELGTKIKLKINIAGPWNDQYYIDDIGMIVNTSGKYLVRMFKNQGFLYLTEDQIEIIESSNNKFNNNKQWPINF